MKRGETGKKRNRIWLFSPWWDGPRWEDNQAHERPKLLKTLLFSNRKIYRIRPFIAASILLHYCCYIPSSSSIQIIMTFFNMGNGKKWTKSINYRSNSLIHWELWFSTKWKMATEVLLMEHSVELLNTFNVPYVISNCKIPSIIWSSSFFCAVLYRSVCQTQRRRPP